MVQDYVPLLILTILAGGFAVTNMFITFVVGPCRPTREKLSSVRVGNDGDPAAEAAVSDQVLRHRDAVSSCSTSKRFRFIRGRCCFGSCTFQASLKCSSL